MIILVTGGARSGKSDYAERVARHLGEEARHTCYLATGEACDEEMKERIAKHQASRRGLFFTVEEPVAIAKACQNLPSETKAVLLDCLTTWLGNISYRLELEAQQSGAPMKKAEDSPYLDEWLEFLEKAPFHVVMVSNELGMGLVPIDAMSRAFRDAQGRLNQKIAARADAVVFMVSGCPLAVKGQLPL